MNGVTHCAVFFFCAQKAMARLGAEVRHINHGGRIIGYERDRLARRKRAHPLAQAQDGQGAEKAYGINCFAHMPEVLRMFQPVHRLVTESANDAASVMR